MMSREDVDIIPRSSYQNVPLLLFVPHPLLPPPRVQVGLCPLALSRSGSDRWEVKPLALFQFMSQAGGAVARGGQHPRTLQLTDLSLPCSNCTLQFEVELVRFML